MPPVTKAGGQQFRKDVEFVTKDDDEQVAAGIVMVPDKVDLQNDFAREETIRGFADQFEAFVEAGEAGGGVMHAVFPDGWMDLERNEVLDEAEEIGGEQVAAGAWIQEWRINNADLWELVADGILAGYSIGAIQVDWNGPFEQDEVEDVEVPEGVSDEALVWELAEGIIREVSAVDIPAVPDAQILETKADAEKRLGDYLGDPDGFVEEALQRGHSEAEAERLWEVLNDAVAAEGSAEPGEKSLFHRIGKAAFDAFLSNSDASPNVAETPDTDPLKNADTGPECWVCGDDAEYQNDDPPGEYLCAEHADPQGDRVTELSEHDDEETDASPVNNASGGDTPDSTTDMGDTPNDDGGDGDKSLAEQNAEQISELTQAVETLTETLTGPEQKTAEIEIGGETYEVPESQVKAALGVDEDAGVDVADAIESLKSEVEDQQRRLDTISQQSGHSTQIEAAADSEEGDETGLEGLGKALS